MPHYQNSVIYKIKHNEDYDDTNIYVGSTTNFKNRKYEHKYNCNNEKSKKYNLFLYQFIRDNGGWDNWIMIPIEPYSCNSKKELEIRERHHIDLLRPTLNKNIPSRTQKEWYEDNIKKLKELNKEWRYTNKEQILEKNKKYRDDNKKQIAEKGRIKVICEHCGCESRKGNIATHKKSKKCLKSQEENVAR